MTQHQTPPRLHRRYPSYHQPLVYRPPMCRRRATTAPGPPRCASAACPPVPITHTNSSASVSSTDGVQRPAGPLVWINGFPGVGKLTIAQWLHRLLGVDRSLILDHHDNLCVPGRTMLPPTPEVEIADPFATAWCSDPSPCRQKNNGEHSFPTPLVADLLSRPENRAQTILITSCAVENASSAGSCTRSSDEEEVAAAKAVEVTAAMTDRLFIPIYILCREDENMRRVQSVERRYSGSGLGMGFSGRSPKVESAGAAKELTRGRRLFAFEGKKGLEVDVSDMEAHEAAVEILGFIHTRMEEWRREAAAEAR